MGGSGQYSPLASMASEDALISDTELLDSLAMLASPPSSPSSFVGSSSFSSVGSSSSLVSLEDTRAERQRVRVRLKAQRAYRRKTMRMQQLRCEVEELQRRLEQLDEEKQGQDREEIRSPSLDLVKSIYSSDLTVPKTREEIEARLCALWKLGAQLRQEYNELRRKFMAISGFTATICELLSEEYKPYITVASDLLFLRPITLPECLTIHKRCMEVVRSFSSIAMLSAPQISRIGGWRERRELRHGLFRYAMQKRFSRCGSAAALATKSFLLLTEPAQLRRFYSDALDMEVRLVQKVDADNYVVFQEMRIPDADGECSVAKALLLVSRFRVGNAHSIYLYGLQEDELPVVDRHPRVSGSDVDADRSQRTPEFWNDQFCWLRFEDVTEDAGVSSRKKSGDSAVLVSYAGITPTASPFWLVEVVLHCLRWEQIMIGPWVHLAS